MRDPVTGKYQAKHVFKGYNVEVVGTGDTKEEAKANLKEKLKEYRIPGTDYPGYRGPKYRPKMKVAGYVNSPGFQAEMGEDGKVAYVYREDRKAQILTVDRGDSKPVQNLAESAKVSTEE